MCVCVCVCVCACVCLVVIVVVGVYVLRDVGILYKFRNGYKSFDLVSLFYGVSNFVGYLILKPFLYNNSHDTV